MAMKIKIAFVDIKDIEETYLKQHLPANFEAVYVRETLQGEVPSHLENIADAEVLCVFTSSRISEELLKQMPNVKMVTTRSTGVNHIPVDYCKQNNIIVANVPRYGEATVAEFAFGLMLDVMRKVNLAYNDLRDGKVKVQSFLGNDLYEKTIGIIGTGAIGRHACMIAKGFGMNILAFDPYPNQDVVDKFGVKYVSLEELCQQSDVISLHAPATKHNYHMLGDKEFALMKKGVYIVNTARGEIIDTNALYKALQSGIVAGAGLDVLECEEILTSEDKYLSKIDCIHQDCLVRTLINHRLLELSNVVVTPHVAFDSVEAIYRILKTTINNINGYVEGNVPNKIS